MISTQTWHLLEIRRLKNAGLVLGPNDLDFVSWQLLAYLEEILESLKKKREKENDR